MNIEKEKCQDCGGTLWKEELGSSVEHDGFVYTRFLCQNIIDGTDCGSKLDLKQEIDQIDGLKTPLNNWKY